MSRRRCINDYRGFEGPDADIATSLFEYGLAWKKIKKEEFIFIYGVNVKEKDHDIVYNRFDIGFMTKKDYLSLINENWVKLDSVLNFCDCTRESAENGFPYFVHDLIMYHGTENIFGTSYAEGFEILE